MSDNYNGGVATQETPAATPANEGGDSYSRPTGGTTPQGGEQQESTEGQSESKWWEGKNFDEAPPFQNLKSTYDTRLKNLNDNFVQAQRTIQESQRRMMEMERAIEQQQLSGADDYQKLEHFYKKEQARNQQLEQQLNAVYQEISRQRYISAIKDEFGVDLTDKQFNTPDEAMVVVARMQREKAAEFEKKLQQAERRANANQAADNEKPDLSGTGTPIGKNAMQRQYDEAMINLQGDLADRVARQAVREGIEIDRFSWLSQRKDEG